jgi:flagellar FliJ protein
MLGGLGLVKYKFSLEKVLEWRVDKEKAAAKEFLLLQKELDYQEATLNNLRLEDEKIKKKILKLSSIQELKRQYLFKQKIEERIEKQIELIEKTKEELEVLRQELLEAQKDRKIMENLKERDYNSYKEELMRIEQKELDEVAVLRYDTVGDI